MLNSRRIASSKGLEIPISSALDSSQILYKGTQPSFSRHLLTLDARLLRLIGLSSRRSMTLGRQPMVRKIFSSRVRILYQAASETELYRAARDMRGLLPFVDEW